MHPLFELIQKENKSPAEHMVLEVVQKLKSTRFFMNQTPEQCFDAVYAFWCIGNSVWAEEHMILRELVQSAHLQAKMLTQTVNKLNSMENTLTAQSTALTRLQTDYDNLKKQNDQQIAALSDLQAKQKESNDSLLAIIEQLRSAGNDEAAIAAIADDMENNLLPKSQQVLDGLTQAAGAEVSSEQAGQGTPPPPPPPPPNQLTIDPPSVTLVPGATQQFTASAPVNWSADNGSIDSNGMYTASSDPSLTSDVVHASAQDGSGSADAQVTIQAA